MGQSQRLISAVSRENSVNAYPLIMQSVYGRRGRVAPNVNNLADAAAKRVACLRCACAQGGRGRKGKRREATRREASSEPYRAQAAESVIKAARMADKLMGLTKVPWMV
jgi:hypothetical protein